MLLQNFVKSHQNGVTFQYDFSNGGGLTNASNLWYDAATSFKSMKRAAFGSSGNFVYLALGSGNTAPTFTDYTVTDVTAQLTFVSGSLAKINENMIISVSQTFRNDTESAITVKEIGFGFGQQSNQGQSVGILLTRSVLETPVTIGAGESYSFTYSIEV